VVIVEYIAGHEASLAAAEGHGRPTARVDEDVVEGQEVGGLLAGHPASSESQRPVGALGADVGEDVPIEHDAPRPQLHRHAGVMPLDLVSIDDVASEHHVVDPAPQDVHLLVRTVKDHAVLDQDVVAAVDLQRIRVVMPAGPVRHNEVAERHIRTGARDVEDVLGPGIGLAVEDDALENQIAHPEQGALLDHGLVPVLRANDDRCLKPVSSRAGARIMPVEQHDGDAALRRHLAQGEGEVLPRLFQAAVPRRIGAGRRYVEDTLSRQRP